MPVIFDFINSGPQNIFIGSGSQTLTNTDVDMSGSGRTVKFTLSTDAAGGFKNFGFGNEDVSAIGKFYVSDFDLTASTNSANDIFTLRFEDTDRPSFNLLSGTASNPIVLQNDGAIGEVRLDLLSAGGGVIGGTTITGLEEGDRFSFVQAGVAAIRFTGSTPGGDALAFSELRANALNCFLAGTRIMTPTGEISVEALTMGDVVEAADGRAVEVTWLGFRRMDTRLTHPERVNPICITAGALADGVPERDLYVSPDHAIGVDGCLVNASLLVNGETIYKVAQMPLEGFTYYHIETEAHELLLAEGCPAESYIDQGEWGFDNAGERAARVIPEMPLPRISAARMIPETVAARLKARAAELSDCQLAG